MTTPLLSVLIDTYNHEKYIEQAIVSAIEQNFLATDYEIVVVDDGSTDRTPEIVQKFAPRVRLLRKKNGGQASAFNAAFPELRGEIVAFLDGDDWFAPGKLATVMAALEQHPEAAAVGHGYYMVQEDTGSMEIRVPPLGFVHLKTKEGARRAFWDGLICSLLMGALTVRKNVYGKVVPIAEDLVFCGDNPIAVAALAGGAYALDQPLFYYRHHAGSRCAPTAKDTVQKMRRRHAIFETMFELMGPLLERLEVPPEIAAEFLYPNWVEYSRYHLARYGGSRLCAFRTEMREFHFRHPNAKFNYRAFKYLGVGGATLLLPPRLFYRMRDWYARENIARLREQLARTR